MTLHTKQNGKVELKKVYDRGERFFGKVLVSFNDSRSPMRITLEEWEEIIVAHVKENKKN